MTSSTVIGLPSWNRASARSVNATQVRSAGISMLSAISPYSEDGSSHDAIVSVSNCCAAAAAATPFNMKGFRLSKVPMAARRTSPPFGASGLT
jgi:hypothetical protein